jgi:regulatory protein
MSAQPRTCLDAALKILKGRLHSAAELRRKLSVRKWDKQIIDATIDQLIALGYLNDQRFAMVKTSSAAKRRQHGPKRAMAELLKSGVQRDVAERAVEDVYAGADNLSVARDLARKHADRLKKLDPLTARRRLAGMLQRRGFDYDTIKPVIDEILRGSGPET